MPVSDQSRTARRVHKESGLMQWLDSPAADLDAARHWPYRLDAMFGMSMFFYEQQRLGPLPPDTRPPWRADSLKRDGGGFLDEPYVNGYADAGDFLKFQLPTTYSLARLGWLTHRFASTLESTHFDGEPNLVWARQAVKWGADFMSLCVEEDRVLLHLGDIKQDHAYIGRAEDYPQIDRTQVWCESGQCSDVTGEMAATLAHAAVVFKDSPELSALYWDKAKQAFAQTNAQTEGAVFGNSIDAYPELAVYYTSSGVVSHVLFGAVSMYTACKALECGDEAVYLDVVTRLGNQEEAESAKWFWPVPGWDNAWFDAAVLMASQGVAGPDVYDKPAFTSLLSEFVAAWVSGTDPVTISPNGQRFTTAWASLRFSLNGAATLLLWADLPQDMQLGDFSVQEARCAGVRQVLYAAGMNDRGSYMAGFGENPPQRNHHRSSVCAPWEQRESDAFTCEPYFVDVINPRGECVTYEDSSKGICFTAANRPNKFQTAGALIGGPKTPDDAGDQDRMPYSEEGWNDWRTDWVGSEQTLDYNAGLSVALAAAMSLPPEFWQEGCTGVDDFSSILGAGKAHEPYSGPRWGDDEVYTFADFEEYGWTRTLDADWFTSLPAAR